MDNTPDLPVTRIRPNRGWLLLGLAELWTYRELLYFFCWRDFKVRYKQTVLGMLWSMLGPVAFTIIFVVIFGRLAKLPTDSLPQPVFYMTGLVVWGYFSKALMATSMSLVSGGSLMTKVYFPRLMVPLSSCVIGLVDFVISFVVLLGLLAYFGIYPPLTSLLLPVLLLQALFTALGFGLLFGALNVRFRDVRSLVPFIVQFWMYASIIIPFSQVPQRWGNWRYLYGLNPLGGIVEGFRWCLTQHLPSSTMDPPWLLLAAGMPVTLLALLTGLLYFRRVERQLADIL
jgi:homopolymeric O-antigen transport system permease protein